MQKEKSERKTAAVHHPSFQYRFFNVLEKKNEPSVYVLKSRIIPFTRIMRNNADEIRCGIKRERDFCWIPEVDSCLV